MSDAMRRSVGMKRPMSSCWAAAVPAPWRRSRPGMPAPKSSSSKKGKAAATRNLRPTRIVCPTDNAAARAHIKALSFGIVSEEIIDVYVHWTAQNIDYIKQLGGEVESCFPGASFPQVTGAETMLRFRVKGKAPRRAGRDISVESSLRESCAAKDSHLPPGTGAQDSSLGRSGHWRT